MVYGPEESKAANFATLKYTKVGNLHCGWHLALLLLRFLLVTTGATLLRYNMPDIHTSLVERVDHGRAPLQVV
jgi:hypothetical protein